MANKPVTYKAFAGLRNTLPAERLEPTDLTVASNVDIDDSGRLSRRAGTTQQVAGAAHSLWSSGDVCLVVQGTRLLRLLPDMSTDELVTGLTPDRPVAYVEVAGRIYWTNGESTGAYVEGVSRSWGLPVPPVPDLSTDISPATGSLLPGVYQVALTYLRADGQEGGAGLAAAITVEENGGIRMRWEPITDPNITDVAIYLSEPNGEQLYRAGIVPADHNHAGILGASLSLPLATQWLDAPPAGQCLTVHRGRIVIAAGAHLFATTALGYELADLRDYLAVDDSAIRFVVGVEHGLYVGTERAVYFLAGDRLDDMTVKTVVDAPAVADSAVLVDGALVSGDAALAGQQVALFATGLGVCLGTIDGSVSNLTEGRYHFAASPTGAATFRITDSGIHQYLLFLS